MLDIEAYSRGAERLGGRILATSGRYAFRRRYDGYYAVVHKKDVVDLGRLLAAPRKGVDPESLCREWCDSGILIHPTVRECEEMALWTPVRQEDEI